jgi:hypothetical protein
MQGVTGTWGKYAMKSFLILLFTKYYYSDENEN